MQRTCPLSYVYGKGDKVMFDRLNDNIDRDMAKIECQQQKKHELTLIGSQRRVRGLTLFSFNTETKEIKKAEIDYCKDYIYYHPYLYKEGRDRVIVEKNCIYRQALNTKNFIKVLKREGYL